jgi:alpha-galactosidase
MGWRAGTALPAVGLQGEGLLAVSAPGAPTRTWYAPEPWREVPSIRLESRGDRLVVSSNGSIVEVAFDGTLDDALAGVGDRLAGGRVRSIPPGWCSWSAYFGQVTAADVVENLHAAERLELPIEIVQVDDGYEPVVGDWLEENNRFGSLRQVGEAIRSAGKTAGVWTAPFLVGERSLLARSHPEWLVEDADAGWNWNQRLLVLDVTHPAAAAHLRGVYETLVAWGFRYFKLDFLYAGALGGRRHADCTALEAYREGLRLVRLGAGHEAIQLGCGAPLLPSIGLVDAMRIGPDVLPEPVGDPPPAPDPDLAEVARRVRARAWTHGRLWVADPDCLVARAEIAERTAWASQIESLGGLAFSGDRLGELDELGLELTRRTLRPSSPNPVARDGR